MLHLDLLPHWGGGGGSGPWTTGQWQRAVQLEVNSVSPCAPLGHRSRISRQAVLRGPQCY